MATERTVQPKTKRRLKVTKIHTQNELAELTELLRRAHEKDGDGAFDPEMGDLADELAHILTITGLCLPDVSKEKLEIEYWWRDLTDSDPTHRDARAAYSAAAEAEDPLAEGALPPFLRAEFCSALARRLNSQWQRRRNNADIDPSDIAWDHLTEHERDIGRKMLLQRAAYAGSYIVKGRPRKNDLNMALYFIAQLFVQHARKPNHEVDLPVNEESLFIRFAATAMKGRTDPLTEAAPEALARRCARRKKNDSAGVG